MGILGAFTLFVACFTHFLAVSVLCPFGRGSSAERTPNFFMSSPFKP
jgi:hypothetical protein